MAIDVLRREVAAERTDALLDAHHGSPVPTGVDACEHRLREGAKPVEVGALEQPLGLRDRDVRPPAPPGLRGALRPTDANRGSTSRRRRCRIRIEVPDVDAVADGDAQLLRDRL